MKRKKKKKKKNRTSMWVAYVGVDMFFWGKGGGRERGGRMRVRRRGESNGGSPMKKIIGGGIE